MFSSLVQTSSLVLALSLVVSAQQIPRTPHSSDEHTVALEDPTAGVVYTHLFPGCGGRRLGGKKPMTVPVDRCLTIHGFGLQIKTPAVCTNGTRAKWARFEDTKCGYGEISPNYGLIDVKDSELMECLSTDASGGGKKISSMSFWCDGFGDVKKPDPNAPEEPAAPKPAKGSTSESACAARGAPFFDHPNTDTCVNLKTNMMKIYSTGVCANGTSALLAKFDRKGCMGSPASFTEVTKESGNLEKCLNFEGTDSYAFWCDGKGVVGLLPVGSGGSGRSRASVILVVVLIVFASILAAMVGAWAWLSNDARMKIKELFSRKDGGIAL
ncbi:hypothetical protein VTL71DRAFT_5566 [Oculimacula yallundae]|uniref:Uncharacterized protein n=1 Tax=Oculimacula yallundae TaxID=86028 RepID=A0ABR4C1G6_9HELO